MRFSNLLSVFLLTLVVPNWAEAGASGPISAGYEHTCVLSSNSMAYCWGNNTLGQLGNGRRLGDLGSSQYLPRPVQVLNPDGNQPLSLLTAISAGGAHTCASTWIAANVLCWGDDTFGELGDGRPLLAQSLPTFVLDKDSGKPIASALSVDAGDFYSCALIYGSAWYNTYSIACWGDGVFGELGDNSSEDEEFPVPLKEPSLSLTQIATGGWHTCAVDVFGHAWCWGFNDADVGDGGYGVSYVPVQVLSPSGVGPLLDVNRVALGDRITCALTANTTVFCWGDNAWGELGNGTGLSSSPLPMQVIEQSGAPLQDVSAIAAGGNHVCALKSDTTVVCWGQNSSGELGNADPHDSRLPVQVLDAHGSPIDDIGFIAAGFSHTCAMKRDYSVVWCWGNNNYGQLGNGTFENSSVALPVDFDTIFIDGLEGS